MNIRFKIFSLFVFSVLSLFAKEVTIKGNITIQENNIDLYIFDIGGNQPQPVAINTDNSSYCVSIDVERPVFVYLFVRYIQYVTPKYIFTSVFLNEDTSEIKIDISGNRNLCYFVPLDKDNKALVSYYQDFRLEYLTNVSIEDELSVTNYLTHITEGADSIAKTATSDIVKNYISLRGQLDRISETTRLQSIYREHNKRLPQSAVMGIVPTTEIIKNKVAIYFPQEIAQLVMSDIAVGRTIHERLDRLRREVKDSVIIANTETLLINRFIDTYDFSQGLDAGLEILDSIAKHHSQYEQMLAQMKLRSYSMPGGEAPNIALTDVNGETHFLSDFKGKYIYVDFWASWCGPCNVEIPYMKELERTLNNEMVVFVGISIDEDINAWKNAMMRHALRGNQFIAPKEMSQMLNIQSIPRYVIYDKDGKLMNVNAPRPSSGAEIRSLLMQLK